MPRLGLSLVLLSGCGPEVELSPFEQSVAETLSPLGTAPDDPTNAVADDDDAAALGHALFFDAGLSSNGAVSCATCHDPAIGLTDGLHLSEGLATTPRHAPTAWNSAWNRWFFWDGRCDTAWCQALGPIENDKEMGATRLSVAHHIADDPALATAYVGVFGALPDLADRARFPADARPIPSSPDDPRQVAWAAMTEADQHAATAVFVNVGKAIAAYERRLVTGEAPFDRWIARRVDGDPKAWREVDASVQRGFVAFVDPGQCWTCHGGPNLSAGEFANIGLGPRDWLSGNDGGRLDGIAALLAGEFRGDGDWSDDPAAAERKIGFLSTGEEHLSRFKIPTLRNVTGRGPYMHGGHFDTLAEVLDHYNRLEERPPLGHRDEQLLPMDLDDEALHDLEAFLGSLTGPGPDPAWLEAPTTP